MKTPTREQRIGFWKVAYARASFVKARLFARHILEAPLPLNHPVREALTIAVLTTYSRPFKQRHPVRLSEDTVPAQFRETHDTAIEIRDKVITHRDMDGPVADWGFVSQLEIAVGGGGLAIDTRSPVISDSVAKAMLPLLDHLIMTMNRDVDAFTKKYLMSVAEQDGVYVLRFDDHPTEWTTRIR